MLGQPKKNLMSRMGWVGALMIAPAFSAHAYVECTLTPTAAVSADDGSLYIYYVNQGIGHITASDADFKPTLALVLSAILTDRNLMVRYPDGYACNATFAPILAVQLTK